VHDPLAELEPGLTQLNMYYQYTRSNNLLHYSSF